MLVFIGALDDRFDISVKIRATIQAAVGIVMMVFGKLYLSSLGYIFGSWEMVLGPFGYFLTLFAVWAAINAFNMVDGIDGLLGGLSCVSFAAIGMILRQGAVLVLSKRDFRNKQFGIVKTTDRIKDNHPLVGLPQRTVTLSPALHHIGGFKERLSLFENQTKNEQYPKFGQKIG